MSEWTTIAIDSTLKIVILFKSILHSDSVITDFNSRRRLGFSIKWLSNYDKMFFKLCCGLLIEMLKSLSARL